MMNTVEKEVPLGITRPVKEVHVHEGQFFDAEVNVDAEEGLQPQLSDMNGTTWKENGWWVWFGLAQARIQDSEGGFRTGI